MQASSLFVITLKGDVKNFWRRLWEAEKDCRLVPVWSPTYEGFRGMPKAWLF